MRPSCSLFSLEYYVNFKIIRGRKNTYKPGAHGKAAKPDLTARASKCVPWFLPIILFTDIELSDIISTPQVYGIAYIVSAMTMALSLRSMASQFMLSGAIRQTTLPHFTTASVSFPTSGFLAHLLPTRFLPWISIQLPTLGSIWDSILKAVPKKKTSHRKKRQRFLAGKALKDVTNLNKCSGCGNIKKAHHLCPYCVRGKCYLYVQSIRLTRCRNQGHVEW